MYTVIALGIFILGYYLMSKVKDSFSIENNESEKSLFPNIENSNTTDNSLSKTSETLDNKFDVNSHDYSSINVEGPLSMQPKKMKPSFHTVEELPNDNTQCISKDNTSDKTIRKQKPSHFLIKNNKKKLRQAIIWKEILDNKFINK